MLQGVRIVVARETREGETRAFGTSARSPTLTDWPGGAMSGSTARTGPDLLPGRVSHGCIRMRNRDILRLARLMPVATPATVRHLRMLPTPGRVCAGTNSYTF